MLFINRGSTHSEYKLNLIFMFSFNNMLLNSLRQDKFVFFLLLLNYSIHLLLLLLLNEESISKLKVSKYQGVTHDKDIYLFCHIKKTKKYIAL